MIPKQRVDLATVELEGLTEIVCVAFEIANSR
jgi:hypothetical protein